MTGSRGAPRSARGSLPEDALISHRYVVRRLLGRGGMGFVYRVFDSARGHDVALKQLRPMRESKASRPSFAADEETAAVNALPAGFESVVPTKRLAQFEAEFHTLAELAHPRIIEAYDYGFEQGLPFYTMELLTGRDIAELAPSPWPRVCAVLRDVASALTLLHSRRLLHRDLSPSNVHQQSDGTCKLIDFGALGTMGKPNAIVGTAAFMPPELLRQLPLDARSDLYSLAALAYYLLTRRTVHPVRSLADLYGFLDARPSPPSTHAMGVPRALDALLLQLLSPDPAARPSSTIEVLERLSAIDGAELDARKRSMPLAVSTPGLVGRAVELKFVRKRLSLALRGKGASLLVTGSAGCGRSRFLDACVLEGRLSGARVLRSAADTSAPTPYGVVGTLLRQLQASLGSIERRELTLPEDVARALLPGALMSGSRTEPHPSTAPADASPPDWNAIGVSLLAYLSRVAARRCVMVTIDDLERVDTPSAALIAALAQRAEADNLVVLAAVDGDLTSVPETVRNFKAHARELPLGNLNLSETEGLLTSLFGEIPNLSALATRLHSLSAGNPRLTMELVQHLIDAGVIRCETGGYLLPEVISGNDLPNSLADALRARVARLSVEAQALASTLALCMGVPLSGEESFAISEIEPERQGPRALAELNDAQIAELRGAHVSLRQPAMADALRNVLPAPARRALHARIAAELVRDPARLIHAADQYFRADLPSEAIDALLSVTVNSYVGRVWLPGYNTLAQRGIEACARLGRPAKDAFTLQTAQIQQLIAFNEPYERTQLLAFCQQLCRLSGLSDYNELSPDMPAAQRLSEALARADARYRNTPEHARTLAPAAAVGQLASYVGRAIGFGSMAMDMDLFASLPSLAPFVPLSRTIAFVELLKSALFELRSGRLERYLELMDDVLAQLRSPDCAGYQPAEVRGVEVNLLHGLALINAALGRPAAFDYARHLDELPNHRVNAWRVRQNAHLFLCDPGAAEVCRRELELLQLQEGTRQFQHGGTVELEAIAYGLSDDLLGLRRVLPAIEEMAERHPGWRPKLLATRAILQRVRGRLKEALSLCEEALALVPDAHHPAWPLAASCQLQVLIELGRAREAQQLGVSYLRMAEQERLIALRHWVEVPLADAEALLGMFERARAHVDRMLAEALERGFGGLPLGILYEAGARQALLARDKERFAHDYAACAQHFKYGRNPALTARLDRLMDQARNVSIAPAPDTGASELNTGLVLARLTRALPEERGAEALKLLMSATGAAEGHLFKVGEGGLTQLASFSPLPAPPYLQDFLLRYLQSSEVVNDQTVDVSYHTSLIEAEVPLEPLALSVTRRGERTVVAVAALNFSGARRWPDPKLLESISEHLAAG